MVVEVLLVAVLGVPAIFLLFFLRGALDRATDEVGKRLSERADVARRLPYQRSLRNWGVLSVPLAVLILATGLKGHTSAHLWGILLVIAAGILLVGTILLALWWTIAGSAADAAARSRGSVSD